MRSSVRPATALTVALVASTFASGASAQTTTPPSAEPPITAGTRQDAQHPLPDTAAQDRVPGDIIVTAQRREERLQDVPATISAYSGNLLERSGIQDTKQLSQITPGLNFTQSSYSPQPTIRGIGTRGVSAGDESVVPVYVDGVYQPVLNNTVMDLNAVERIEILKGPQGTLFGRNATGGAINIITRTPSAQSSAEGSVSYGRFNELLTKAYLTGGFGPIAADVGFVRRYDGGYIRNIATGGEFGVTHNTAVRAKIRYAPSSVFDATLIYNHAETYDTTPFATQAQNGNTIARRFSPNVLLPSGDFETTVTDSGALTSNNDAIALSASLHIGSINITSITSYQDNRLDASADSDTTPYRQGYQYYTNFSKSYIQELYVTGTMPRFNWIVGGTYFHDRSGVSPQVLVAQAFPSGALSVTDVTSAVLTRSFAGYAQGSYDLTDHLNVTVGGRYTNDYKHFYIIRNDTRASLIGAKVFTKFTPTGTIKYTFNSNLNIYAKAGEAFKAGIFPSTTFSATPVNPETVTQYELGAKFGGDGFRGNIAGYYTSYDNVQVNVRDPVTLVSTLQNAASAELYGLDGELAYRASPGFNLRAGLSLIHAKYLDYKNAVVTAPTGLGGNASAFIDASGKDLIRTPFVTANGGFDYVKPIGSSNATATLNASYIGFSYWEASNRVREPAKVLINGEIGWGPANGSYKIAVWGDNILDTRYHLFVLSSTTADSQVFAKPATYGVRVSFKIR